nr:T6SS immunity protein Tdi1 domain-containing protein [Aquabacterium terrae]
MWGTQSGFRYQIVSSTGWILQKSGSRADIATGEADRSLRWFFSGTAPESLDIKDKQQRRLFDRAVAKLGSLAADEVFAFEPMLALGGKQELDHLARRNIHVHLDLLAQVTPREILDRAALAKRAFGA